MPRFGGISFVPGYMPYDVFQREAESALSRVPGWTSMTSRDERVRELALRYMRHAVDRIVNDTKELDVDAPGQAHRHLVASQDVGWQLYHPHYTWDSPELKWSTKHDPILATLDAHDQQFVHNVYTFLQRSLHFLKTEDAATYMRENARLAFIRLPDKYNVLHLPLMLDNALGVLTTWDGLPSKMMAFCLSNTPGYGANPVLFRHETLAGQDDDLMVVDRLCKRLRSVREQFNLAQLSLEKYYRTYYDPLLHYVPTDELERVFASRYGPNRVWLLGNLLTLVERFKTFAFNKDRRAGLTEDDGHALLSLHRYDAYTEPEGLKALLTDALFLLRQPFDSELWATFMQNDVNPALMDYGREYVIDEAERVYTDFVKFKGDVAHGIDVGPTDPGERAQWLLQQHGLGFKIKDRDIKNVLAIKNRPQALAISER